MASLIMLVSWTIWNERNARVFRHKNAPPTILLKLIVDEANDVGWNPRWPIFHERSGSREEHEEHKGKHEGKREGKHERNTKTNKIDHTCA